MGVEVITALQARAKTTLAQLERQEQENEEAPFTLEEIYSKVEDAAKRGEGHIITSIPVTRAAQRLLEGQGYECYYNAFDRGYRILW